MFEELRPKNEEEWLKLRITTITATDIGVLLGLNPWKSVKELIEGKKSYTPIDNSYIWLGQTLEPVVVEATNKVLGTNFKLYEDERRTFFRCPEIQLGATPDAYEGDILLEAKTTKPGNALRWAYWPPAYYVSQLYCQLICTGKQEGYLSILGTDLTQMSPELILPISVFSLTRSEKLDILFIEETKRFWKTQEAGKCFRVRRKDLQLLELELRLRLEKIL